ncbi:MAG: hypothetical protein NTY59_15675 [Alphaproteobacteria bacterium]|nr:hypothetical protein [Alphaproteobacteria bacterium]
MRLFPVLAFAALIFAIAPPVHAAKTNKADTDTCGMYQHRVDDALAANPNAKKLERAKSAREAGEKACEAGQYDAGIKHFKAALSDLGVKAVKQQ